MIGESITTRSGIGHAIGHHGEVFQGVTESVSGALVRTLVTLPCHDLGSKALFRAIEGGGLNCADSWRRKSIAAAELTLRFIGQSHFGGDLSVESNIPAGLGLGSSTADVVATIRAVANAFGQEVSPQGVGRLAVKAEIASDSIMFGDQAVLFAQREGRVIEYLGQPLPPIEVVSINTNGCDSAVDTINMPLPDYTPWEVATFRTLLGLMRRAVRAGDATLLGRIATVSAEINQRFLPKVMFPLLRDVVRHTDALGIQVAHSGTVLGVLCRPEDSVSIREVRRRVAAELGVEAVQFRSYCPLSFVS
jgi:uncharacterized protein involved in propanediol utilization